MSNYFNKNLYEILEISPDADEAKIKSAYRSMARKYHPDVNPNDKNLINKFKEITETYEILMDKDKKALYDGYKGYNRKKRPEAGPKQASRAYKEAQKSGAGATTASAMNGRRKQNDGDVRVSQGNSTGAKTHDKKAFSNVFNDILEGLFEGENPKNKTKQPPKDGEDITSNITITQLEAIQGTHRTVNILHTEICSNCGGRKFINGVKCPLCKGSGETSIHKKINVKIPKDIKQGSKIRIANEGNKGYFGGKDGDLYLVVDIEKNKSKFTFEGLNTLLEVPITPAEAALGAEINIPTPNGSITMKIPPLTSSGQKFRLSSQGLKDDDSKKSGDMIVTIKIELPQNLSEEETQLYKKLSAVDRTNVRSELFKND